MNSRYFVRTVCSAWAAAAVGWGCQEMPPTANDDDLFPVEPKTAEVVIAFDDFVLATQVIGGFGSPSQLGRGPVATDFEGLDSRAIVRFAPFPDVANVRDSAGVTRPDPDLTFVGGRVVVLFDTLTSQLEVPMRVSVERTTLAWHVGSVSWTAQVDTVGDRLEWPEPGGGPFEAAGEGIADLAMGDSVVIPVDSSTVAIWGDSTDVARGLIIRALDTGRRLDVEAVRLRLNTRPSINPDTIVDVSVSILESSFIFDPLPDPPPDGIRVGGAPAWRSFLTMRAPPAITEPHPICAEVECPLEVTASSINQAELLLTSRATEVAFQPTDTTSIDVRAVVAPELLPRAPLGGSLAGLLGIEVPPSYFAVDVGSEVALPITDFIRDLARGETLAGEPAPTTLALLSIFEPASLGFLSFDGSGSASPPMLRLVVTISGTVELP